MENLSVRERKREAVTQAIFKVAEKIWMTEGKESVGMALIAKNAGIAVGTLYNYFADKETLLTGLVKSRCDEIKNFIGVRLDELKDQPIEAKLKTALEIAYGEAREINEARAFLITVYRNDQLLSDLKRVEDLGFSSLLKPSFEQASASGEIIKMDAQLLISIFTGISVSVYNQYLLCSLTTEEAIKLTVSTTLRGLSQK